MTCCEGRHSAKGGRNKWEELCVPEMPLPLDIWANAIKGVDKDLNRVKRGSLDPGYRVPEPALLISGQTPARRQLFMTNWLAIRPLWISRLDHDPPARFPSPQEWREILHGVSHGEDLEAAPATSKAHSTAKGRKLIVLKTFGEEVAAMTQGSCFAPKNEVEWRGKYISITSLANPPPRVIKAVLWEVYEIGWRYELCALDQALNPRLWTEHRAERLSFLHALFPGSAGLVLWSEKLPSRPGDLGLTDSFPENKCVLGTFCLLLSTWPNAHPSLGSFQFIDWSYRNDGRMPIHVYDVVSRACRFYVQTFFDHFGRPPLLPHRFPLEYHE